MFLILADWLSQWGGGGWGIGEQPRKENTFNVALEFMAGREDG